MLKYLSPGENMKMVLNENIIQKNSEQRRERAKRENISRQSALTAVMEATWENLAY
jgi:hypothetical protein